MAEERSAEGERRFGEQDGTFIYRPQRSRRGGRVGGCTILFRADEPEQRPASAME